MSAPLAMVNKNGFEVQTCSRCGGTGHYSYCQRFGTICFKCRGGMVVFTKRGAEAYRFFNELLSIKAKDIQPGMEVRALTLTATGELGGDRCWSKVTALEDNNITRRTGVYRNRGTAEEFIDYNGTNIVSEHMTFCGVDPEAIYRVRGTLDERKAALEKAMAYQATLTKTGTVKRRSK